MLELNYFVKRPTAKGRKYNEGKKCHHNIKKHKLTRCSGVALHHVVKMIKQALKLAILQSTTVTHSFI